MHGTRVSRLLGVRNYLKNYFAIYIHSDALLYTRGSRNPRLLGVRDYLKNYFVMYNRLKISRIRVELISPAFLELGIIKKIICQV